MKRKFCIAVLTGLMATFAVASASGKYIFPYVVDSNVSCSENFTPSEETDDDSVAVTFSYRLLYYWEFHSDKSESYDTGGLIGTRSSEKYDEFFDDLHSWLGNTDGYGNPPPEKGTTINAGQYTYEGANGTAVVNVDSRIRIGSIFGVTLYYGEATINFTGRTFEPSYDDLSDIPNKQLIMEKGSLLPVNELSQGGSLQVVNLEDKYPGREWSIAGFYLDDVPFDISTPIEEDCNIRVELVLNDASEAFSSPLGTRISSLGSGTYNFYVGSSDDSLNIALDPSFNKDFKTVSLGKSGGVTIASGVTVNFSLSGGSLTQKNAAELTTVEPNPSNLSFCAVLHSDLIIQGTLALGSSYGNTSSLAIQSAIGGEYVALDLNGHDIIIEGSGRLDSYGLIYDSKGTGTIHVVGGTISTLAVITDYKGGSHTLAMQKNTVFPFTAFSFPYLRARTSVEYGSEWGKVIANCNVCLVDEDSLSILGWFVDPYTNFVLNFIGPSASGNPYFFQLQGSGKSGSGIVLEAVKDEQMSSTGSVSNYALNYRLSLEMNNVKALLYKFEFSMSVSIINVDIDTSDYIFPIPAVFDIRMYSSNLTIKQAIQFTAGSTLLADENSYILMSYIDGNTSADISVLDRGVNYYDLSKKAVVNNDFSASGSVTLDPSTKSADFLSRYSAPHIKVDGTIVFRTGNSRTYRLAGPLDFAKIAVTTSSDDFPSNDSIEMISYSNGENPFVSVNELGANVETFGFNTYLGWTSSSTTDIVSSSASNISLTHYKGYARPLVSHGVAYYTSSGATTESHIGTYSFQTGAFECQEGASDSKTVYFFDCSGTFQAVDTQSCILKKAASFKDNTFTAEDGTTYIYFASMYFNATPVSGKDGYYTFTRERLTNYNGSTAVTVHYDASSSCFVR